MPLAALDPAFTAATEMARGSCLFDLCHQATEHRSLRGEKQLGVAAARDRDTESPGYRLAAQAPKGVLTAH
jgi:hypothetical protein